MRAPRAGEGSPAIKASKPALASPGSAKFAAASDLERCPGPPAAPAQTFAPHFPQNDAPGASGEPQSRHVIWAGGAGPDGGGIPPDGRGCHGRCPYGSVIIGWTVAWRETGEWIRPS